jgi:diguanylate cyclase (GGDEF)-like protein/PAS domain S-box-containing protein
MIHHASHDTSLVILSVAIAILGSYTALDLFRRVCVNAGRARTLWLATAAIAMGLSIWSMHFVAMLAFDVGLPVAYDPALTVLSLLVAIGVTGVAFVAVARPRPRRAHVLAAGLFMGLGISGMHYLGMAAMRLPASLDHDPLLVALSLLIAVGASTAALVLALREPSVGWQAAGAVAAGLAIAGMHYVAMAAAIFTPTGGGPVDAPGLHAPALALDLAAATFALLGLALVAAGVDRRFAQRALDKAVELERRVQERTRDLAEANARLRAIVESLPFDLWVCDLDGRYVLQNSAARRNWGDRLGLRPEDTDSPPELVARWVEHNTRALAGETVRGEDSHPIQGELRHVEKVLAPVESEGEVLGCVGVNIDVTERKRMAAALRASEERLRLAVEVTGLGIWDVDPVSGKRHWSPEFKAILGLPPDARTDPARYAALIHPEEREAIVARYRRAYAPGSDGRYEAEHRIRRADDGAERWVHATGRVFFNPSGRPVRAIGTLEDITARRRADEALRAALERLARHMDNTPLGVIELALDPTGQGPGRVRTWSGQAQAIFGWSAHEALGQSLEELALVHEGDQDKAALVRQDLTSGGRRRASATLRCYTKEGQTRHCCFHASIVHAREGTSGTALLLVEDMTERLEAQRNIHRLAHHDTLTGLPNRLLFQDRLDQALRVAGRQGRKVALMLLDLDHFKEINDSLGHPAGDQLLHELAERLSGLIRTTDTWARLGGDEFALVQTGVRGADDAEIMVRRIMTALERPFTVETQRVHMTASLGVTLFPDDGETPDRLMRNADMALFRAKAAGRRSSAFYRPEMDRELQASRSLQTGLRQALERGGLSLVYQPVFDVRRRRVVAVEALVRWRHPGGGEVPPATFVPIAETSGLIQPLGEWVLREACRQAAAWHEVGLKVAINVSVAQLRDPELLPTLRQVVATTGITATSLELEVTESVFLDPSKDLVLEALHEIAELGVSLAIDDFGAGYSSLGYLKHFPFHKVKIDGSFVRDIGRDRESSAIVAAVIALGHALDKQVTAECIESEPQLAFLAEQGCDLAQGYLLGRPQPAAAIDRLLAQAVPESAIAGPAKRRGHR